MPPTPSSATGPPSQPDRIASWPGRSDANLSPPGYFRWIRDRHGVRKEWIAVDKYQSIPAQTKSAVDAAIQGIVRLADAFEGGPWSLVEVVRHSNGAATVFLNARRHDIELPLYLRVDVTAPVTGKPEWTR